MLVHSTNHNLENALEKIFLMLSKVALFVCSTCAYFFQMNVVVI